MRNGSLGWAVGPVTVLAAALVGLSSCGDAQVRPPSHSGYATLTVAPTPSPVRASAASSVPAFPPVVTGRSPATTPIAATTPIGDDGR